MEGSGSPLWSTARGADGLQVSTRVGLGQLGDGTSWGQGTPGLASGGDQKQRHEGRRAAYVQDAVYLRPPGRELGLQCAKCHWWRS